MVRSQVKIHKTTGGVIPEVAARAHVKSILPVTKKALNDARVNLETIDYLAVTTGPGLIPSLIVGVEFAKGLAFATGKPLIPVNHLAGHLYSPFHPEILNHFDVSPKKIFPIVSLIVSGGHTLLVLMQTAKDYKILGQTLDDAAGEAFDKVAKLLKLPYPGGPALEKLTLNSPKGQKPSIPFPRPMLNSKDYNFSFAGLKTSVLYYLKNNPEAPRVDVAASFQQATVDILVAKTMRAAKEFKTHSVSLSGGVSANRLLRQTLQQACAKEHLYFFVPPLRLCTDNAEMIGLAAAIKLWNGFKPVSYKKIHANPNLQL